MKRTRLLALGLALGLFAPISAFADAGPAAETGAPVAAETPSETPPTETPKPAESGDAADSDPMELGKEIYARIRSGEWLPAFAAMLVLLVWLVRRFGGKMIPALKTKRGGYFVGVGAAFIVTLASWAASGEPFSFGILTGALGAAWAASGGYDTLRDMTANRGA
jgi:hypothetical protein